MSSLDERIDSFRKMAADFPDDELAQYRLGQLLAEAGRHDDAAAAFRRTLELSPHFSKVYSLLAQSYKALGRNEEALATAQAGYKVAAERGDNMPRDEMGRLITELGGTTPQLALPTGPAASGGGGVVGVDGFRCQRRACAAGARARQLPKPPTSDDLGREIHAKVCADCWNDWLRNFSVKVINELRLDLSSDRGQKEYDRYLREFLDLDQGATSLPQT